MPYLRLLSLIALAAMTAFMIGCAAEGENPEAALLRQARAAFVSGEFLRSEELYQNYLETSPDGPDRLEAWERLFDISRNVLQDNDKAAKILEAMMLDASFDPKSRPDIHEKAAELYVSMKDYARAVSVFDDYLNIPGLSAEKIHRAYLEKARALSLADRNIEALETYGTCARRSPDPDMAAECLLEKAALFSRQSRSKEASKVYEDLSKDEGVSAKNRALAAFALAEIYEGEGKKKEALALYESVLESYPNPRAVQTRIELLRK